MNLTDGPAWDYICNDLFRYTGRTDIWAMLRCYRQNRGFRFQVWFRLVDVRSPLLRRLARWQRNRGCRNAMRCICTRRRRSTTASTSAMAPSIVVNPKTQISSNCNLSQLTTIRVRQQPGRDHQRYTSTSAGVRRG